jgi:hypothetical protein
MRISAAVVRALDSFSLPDDLPFPALCFVGFDLSAGTRKLPPEFTSPCLCLAEKIQPILLASKKAR